MAEEDKIYVKNEIAKIFELYGFDMSFSEFQDVFELGAEFGYQLAVNKNHVVPEMESKYRFETKKTH